MGKIIKVDFAKMEIKEARIETEDTKIKAKKAEVQTDELIVKKVTKKNVTPPIEGNITPEQKKTIIDLANEIVEQEFAAGIIKTKKQGVFKVRNALFKKISVPSYNEFHSSKFEAAVKYLKRWRGGNKNNRDVAKNSETWEQDIYTSINAKRNELMQEDEWRALLKNKYGVNSPKDLPSRDLILLNQDLDALRAQHKKNTSQAEKQKWSRQKEREHKLADWLRELQKERHNIDLNSLPFLKKEIWEILANKYPIPSYLFKNISESTFLKFWEDQKLCNSERGGRPITNK